MAQPAAGGRPDMLPATSRGGAPSAERYGVFWRSLAPMAVG